MKQYIVENQKTGKQRKVVSMAAARTLAKSESLSSGQAMAIIAVQDGKEYPQGAYYGRTWSGGMHHRTFHRK